MSQSKQVNNHYDFCQNDEVATRDFVDIVENPKSPFGKNRNDYSLVSVGTFNADSGILVAHEPKTIFHGSNTKL